MITNPTRLLDRILTFKGKSDFADLGLSARLVNALDDSDVDQIIEHNIYFNI